MRNGIERLSARISDLENFDPTSIRDRGDPRIASLEAEIENTLDRVFGGTTREFKRFRQAAHLDTASYNYLHPTPLAEVIEGLKDGKAQSIELLKAAVRQLEEDLRHSSPYASAVAASEAQSKRSPSRRIFIVHGRQDGPREAVARFLERLGFEAIILHEQASRGQTVMEKIDAHGDVGFAVVMLTPDDVGNLKGEEPQPRARQNVLLELGYFLGRLGRQNVCALIGGELEIPSDWRGVINEPFDDRGAWKTSLAKELQAAGFEIDWNKVMR